MQREQGGENGNAVRARWLVVVLGVSLLVFNAVLVVVLFLAPAPAPLPVHVAAPWSSTTPRVEYDGDSVPGAKRGPQQFVEQTPEGHASTATGSPTDLVVQVPIAASGTVLSAMRAYDTVSDTFFFTTKEYPGIGSFVTSLNSVREGDGRYWILYVNGRTSDFGVSNAYVTPGDHVEWRLERDYSP